MAAQSDQLYMVTIYGILGGMVKTTVYLEQETVLALDEMARREGRPKAELIREALRAYTRRRKRPDVVGIGAFQSGRSDVAERAEELLRAAARDR